MSGHLTTRQFEFINALIRQVGISERTALHTCPGIVHDYPGGPPAALRDLTMTQASNLIEYLIGVRDGHRPMPAPLGQTSLFADGASEPGSREGRWGFEEVREYFDDSVYGNGYDSISRWRVYLVADPSQTIETTSSYRKASEMVAAHNHAIADGAVR